MKPLLIISFLLFLIPRFATAESIQVADDERNRLIPTEIYYPQKSTECTIKKKCPVVILGAGYGVPHTGYSFLATSLNKIGYMVVAIRHELPDDPPLSRSGNLLETRSENYIRGAKSLSFIQKTLTKKFPTYNFDSVVLIGHSNGGDISAWLGNEGVNYINSIITLDHRRVPLPRTKNISILSVRASDFEADKGVLPSTQEQELFGSCVVKIQNSRHNDMTDNGPNWLRQRIISIVVAFVSKTKSCQNLKKA